MKIQEAMEKSEFSTNNFNAFIIKFSDVIFPELTDIFNIIFSCGNDNFEKFTIEFVEKHISISMIKRIFSEVIRMNELEGAIPFFQDSFLELLPGQIKKELEKRKEVN